MKMTGRERLLCALDHREPDTVPIFECVYSRPLFAHVLGSVPEVFDLGSVMRLCIRMGYDFAFLPIPGTSGFRPAGMRSGEYTDEWGITYRIDPSTWPIDAGIRPPCANGADLAHYQAPDPRDPARYETLREALALARENGRGAVGNVRGPFSGAWQLFGLENFSLLLYDEPETVHKALALVADFAIEATRVMVEMGVDAVLYSDDYGSSLQPLISPEHFRTFIVPQLARIVREAKRMGTRPILHSDGCIAPLLKDIHSAGFEGLHPIERCPGMDLAAVKRAYGADLCLFGNVDNKDVLVNGTPQDVEAMVRACIRAAAPGGGYCLSSDHSVHDDIPNENVFALYEAGRRWGAYPINA